MQGIPFYILMDKGSGDCAGIHYQFVLHAREDPALKQLKWTLYENYKHVIACGISVDGTLFLVDIGINRICMSFRWGTYEMRKSIFCELSTTNPASTLPFHIFRVHQEPSTSNWIIEYKVFNA